MSLLDIEIPAPLDNLIEQRFATGEPPIAPDAYRIDASMFGPHDADPDGPLAQRMRQAYDDVGLVHVVNTGLTELAAMRELVRYVLPDEMNYEGGANPRDRLEPNVYEIGAPLVARLPYHHEMAYIGESTTAIGFACRAATPGKGATYVSSGVHATDALLATDFGRKLAELGVCYHRNLTDAERYIDAIGWGVYNHWQKSFGTDDPAVAEQRANERGLVTEWGADRLLTTRYYSPAFEYCPSVGRNLLYSSLADHGIWFDTWPLVQHLPYAERPLHMTFGDDSEFTDDELRQFIEVYDRFGMPIEWSVGDVAVMCNYRWAHGRPEIHLDVGEERELGVILGPQFTRQGQPPTTW